MLRRLVLLLAAGTLAATATGVASPRNVQLRVHDDNACSDTACPEGSAIEAGSRISGTLRLLVHAEDTTGMRRVRVEAHPIDDPKGYCVAEADTRNDGTSVDLAFTWDTRNWPSPESGSGCTHTLPHIHGNPTANGRYELRAVAVNLVDDQDTGASAVFPLTLANAPAPVAWAGEPVIDAASRRVALTWTRGAEPDLVAYRIDRLGPDGPAQRFIDARAPERDGCSRLGPDTIRCNDQLPADGGTYTYSLVALRPGGSSRCMTRARCIEGAASEPRPIEVAAAPAASTSPTASATGSGTLVPAGSTPASPTATPIASTSGVAAPAPGGSQGSNLLPFLIVAALLAAGAGTLVAMRARTRR